MVYPCVLCSTEKLSREFPPSPLSEQCAHASNLCCECLVQNAKTLTCPYPECGAAVTSDVWDSVCCTAMNDRDEQRPVPASTTETDEVTIDLVYLTGHKISLRAPVKTSIINLRKKAKESITQTDTVRLTHKGQILEDLVDDAETKKKRKARLSDYNLGAHAQIQVLIVLYSSGSTIANLKFKLGWRFPSVQADYLDASCFLYSGQSRVGPPVDYRNRIAKGVKHSGDMVSGDPPDRCDHVLEVDTNNLTAEVDKIFFTLSAWNAPNIGAFKKTTLKVLNNETRDQVVDYNIRQAKDHQAVCICAMIRGPQNRWEIIALETFSHGNAKDYERIHATLQDLIPRLT